MQDTKYECELVIEEESSSFPKVERVKVIASVPSGEIRIEQGADGAWLLFDCDCKDALPYCQAQCCALIGTKVQPEEEERLGALIEWDDIHGMVIMKRDADGFCTCLNRETRTCNIYEQRPHTCRAFHCTRGAGVRGWKLSNSVNMQSLK